MIKYLLFFLLLLGLVACSSKDIGRDLTSWPDEQLIMAVKDQNTGRVDEEIVSEIRSRDILPEEEWSYIRNGKVFIGMTEDGLIATLGKPTKNSYINAWDGLKKDYTFINGNARYKVKAKNGVVESLYRF